MLPGLAAALLDFFHWRRLTRSLTVNASLAARREFLQRRQRRAASPASAGLPTARALDQQLHRLVRWR